jgi:ubiquinone/menaquinone biosynthesis C-methylase UbiE
MTEKIATAEETICKPHDSSWRKNAQPLIEKIELEPMDDYTKKTKIWLDNRFKQCDNEGIYFAHQPIYGFRKGPSEPGLTDKYCRTYQMMKALSHLEFNSLLDVGGAEGYKAHIVKEIFDVEVRNSDLSEEACKRCKEIFYIESDPVDLHNLPYDDDAFEVILCSETLEHVTDWRNAINELLRVASKAIVITVPHEDKTIIMENIKSGVSHGHIHNFFLNSLDFLEFKGYTVISKRIVSRLLLKKIGFLIEPELKYPPNSLRTTLIRMIFGKKIASFIIKLDDLFVKFGKQFDGILFIILKDKKSLWKDKQKKISVHQIISIAVPYYYLKYPRPHDRTKKRYWLECPVLHDYFTKGMWELKKHWAEYIKEKYHCKNTTCLSIGCGTGELERGLIKIGCAKAIDAFDIDEESIKTAISLSKKSKINDINYFVADANKIFLPENKYDLVVAHNAVYHFVELEHIMTEINKSLKPDGIFVMVEYVGPNRFQWTDKQLKIINDLLKLLSDRYKKDADNDLITKPIVTQKTMEGYLRENPSEAIRSADIVPLLHKHFEVIEEKDMGGTILLMLFANIIDNFDISKEEDLTLLNLLCYFEKFAIVEKEIPSDFKLLIAIKKTYGSQPRDLKRFVTANIF